MLADPIRSLYSKNSAYNLSSYVLSETQSNILFRGTSFILHNENEKFRMKYEEAVQKLLDRISVFDPFLEKAELLSVIKREIRGNLKTRNLSAADLSELNKLIKNNRLIITKSDKGSMWVILNKADYISENLRHLNSLSTYIQIQTPLQRGNIAAINRILTTAYKNHTITAAVYKSLILSKSYKQRRFHTLPKMHKPPSKWPTPHLIPPVRPIISNIDTELQGISKYLDRHLKPLLDKHQQILYSTDHFLHRLSGARATNSCILFTADVESLYTNMDISQCLSITRKFLLQYYTDILYINFLLQLLSICLWCNDFTYNDTCYKQTQGIAMGANFAPTLANLYMADFEERFTSFYTSVSPCFYVRYIDDIFGVFEGTLAQFHEYATALNALDHTVKLIFSSSFTHATFLDATVYKDFGFKNILCVAPHIKETSSMQLIHKTSAHTSHTKKATIQAEILRFLKLSTNWHSFNTTIGLLFSALQVQGYTPTYLRKLKRSALQNLDSATDSQFINLGFHSCGNCNICTYARSICTADINGHIVVITSRTNCQSSNIIYAIQCTLCNLTYIGESKNSLKIRISHHLSDIRTKKETAIANHFNQAGHDTHTHFRCYILHHNHSWSDLKRKSKEIICICRYNTTQPVGINIRCRKHTPKTLVLPYAPGGIPSPTLNGLCRNYRIAHTLNRNLMRMFQPQKHTTLSI